MVGARGVRDLVTPKPLGLLGLLLSQQRGKLENEIRSEKKGPTAGPRGGSGPRAKPEEIRRRCTSDYRPQKQVVAYFEIQAADFLR